MEEYLVFLPEYSLISKRISQHFDIVLSDNLEIPQYLSPALCYGYSKQRMFSWVCPMSGSTHLGRYCTRTHYWLVFPWRAWKSCSCHLEDSASDYQTTKDDSLGIPCHHISKVDILNFFEGGEYVMVTVRGWFWSLVRLSLRWSTSVLWRLLNVSMFC